jgi:hypothetical protein
VHVDLVLDAHLVSLAIEQGPILSRHGRVRVSLLFRGALRILSGTGGGDAIDLGFRCGVFAQEPPELGDVQHQHLAITKGDHIGLAPPFAEQRHLAEKVAAAESHPLIAQHDLDRARRDRLAVCRAGGWRVRRPRLLPSPAARHRVGAAVRRSVERD